MGQSSARFMRWRTSRPWSTYAYTSTTMAAALLVAILAALCGAANVQASMASDSHYVAAVVDFCAPDLTTLAPEEVILKNIDALDGFMKRAAEEGADILVFPEDGLQSFAQPFPMDVPGPEDAVVPCMADNLPKPLRKLSCLAIKHKMYLVANVVQRVNCTRQDPKCPTRNYYNYNTNVAFDRGGKIVARYHKYNLFGEYNNNPAPTPEYSTFDTDFGVRFGMFICFDILFNKPAAQLARERRVTDFAFSAAWFSEVPFLTAVQAHSGWAHALDVTVLAAGMNRPATGSSGSGIYLGRRGIATSTINPRAESTLLVHRVAKHGHDEPSPPSPSAADRLDPVSNYASGKADPYDEIKRLRMIQDNMTMYETKLLRRGEEGEEVVADETLSSNQNGVELRCRFRIRTRGARLFKMSSAAVSLYGRGGGGSSRRSDAQAEEEEQNFDGFHYRMMAFSGVRDHSGVATTGVQVCGLVSCLTEKLESCGWAVGGLGSPSILWTEFLSVKIEGEFEEEGTLQFASTEAGPRYEQLPADHFTLDSNVVSTEKKQMVSLSLERALIDLRTFAIYGRYFAWDGQTPSGR